MNSECTIPECEGSRTEPIQSDWHVVRWKVIGDLDDPDPASIEATTACGHEIWMLHDEGRIHVGIIKGGVKHCYHGPAADEVYARFRADLLAARKAPENPK